MQLTTILSVLSAAAAVIAAPTSSNSTAVAELKKRGNSAECWYHKSMGWAADEATVNMYNWPHDSRGCGRGLLDNLRGQCGVVIEKWTCDYQGDGENTAHAHFYLDGIPKAGCVEQAVWLASGPDHVWNMHCQLT